ncbi:MAG: hypothetical protein ABI857_13790 [Acidobacteriota bacterium]
MSTDLLTVCVEAADLNKKDLPSDVQIGALFYQSCDLLELISYPGRRELDGDLLI